MGIIQPLDSQDNGVPCPRDNMKPAVFVVLAFLGLCAAAPHPDSGYGKQKCQTVYDTDYKTEYKKECNTIYETACETSYKKECYGYGYDKKCKSVPVEKCHQVPKESCKDIPIQVPIKVPREVCDKIPKQITKEIPIHYCDYH